MSIAFFDLDRTILSKNSGSMWVKAELREGLISWTDALRGAFWIGLYHLGAVDIEAPIRDAIATVAGDVEAEVRARTHAFYEREVRGLVRPGARRAIAEHRRRGEKVVLLTTSSCYLSERITDDLDLDGFIANRFEVDGAGRYTGRPIEPLCFGAGKVSLAERYAGPVPLERCSFYTDSVTDLPMLERVGTAVAVHPDPRLRRIASRRGWTIADWSA